MKTKKQKFEPVATIITSRLFVWENAVTTDDEEEDKMAFGEPPEPELLTQASKIVGVEKAWAVLRASINDVYTGKSGGLSRARYMELYNLVSDYKNCIPPKSIRPPLTGDELCSDLYQRLQDFLKTHLERLVAKGNGLTGVDVVSFYAEARMEYNRSSEVLDGICSYLNRTWVYSRRHQGDQLVLPVYQMALVSWRKCFLPPLQVQLISGLLKLIENERNGETINSKHVRSATSSLVELALDNEDPHPKAPNLSLYKEVFENIFLIRSEHFYRQESADYLSRHGVTRYMKKAERRLRQEERRALAYLHKSTLEPLMKVCGRVLVEDHLGVLNEEFSKLLRRELDVDVGRMFRLVSRTTRGHEQLRSSFQEHVLQEGLSAVERVGEDAARDIRMYVNTLLQVYHRYKDLVTTEFGSDRVFLGALEAGCKGFVNSNFVTRLPNPHKETAELLAEYCNTLLLKGPQKTEINDLEGALNEAITLFRFTEDKDLFQRYYSKLLAVRLLRKTSVSEEAETMMISRLKEVCGYGYITKLERMIQDIRVSKVLNTRFNRTMTNARQYPKHGFTAFVLNSGSWPFQASPAPSLPRPLIDCVELFTRYYITKHPSRKLTWLHHISEGELVTTCFKRPYLLRASTMQMVVLLQYNESLSLTLQQLQKATSISMDVLLCVLEPMLKAKLLSLKHKEGPNLQNHEQLSPDAVLSLNTHFSNEKLLVNIRATLETDAKVQKDADEATVKADRKNCIQAAVVRVMKNQGRLKREEIIAEVIGLLSSRFKPDVECIKECIDSLVKKEYLDRAEGDEDTYIYLA